MQGQKYAQRVDRPTRIGVGISKTQNKKKPWTNLAGRAYRVTAPMPAYNVVKG